MDAPWDCTSSNWRSRGGIPEGPTPLQRYRRQRKGHPVSHRSAALAGVGVNQSPMRVLDRCPELLTRTVLPEARRGVRANRSIVTVHDDVTMVHRLSRQM